MRRWIVVSLAAGFLLVELASHADARPRIARRVRDRAAALIFGPPVAPIDFYPPSLFDPPVILRPPGPIGHQITPTGPNGYKYEPIYEPTPRYDANRFDASYDDSAYPSSGRAASARFRSDAEDDWDDGVLPLDELRPERLPAPENNPAPRPSREVFENRSESSGPREF